MIKVAFISDSHWNRSSRFDECTRIHKWIADDMDARGVDLLLHGGDVYNQLSQPEERTAVGAWLYGVAHKRPVLIVRGNHDAMGDLRVLQFLGTPFPVEVEERSSVHHFHVGGNDIQVAAVAWPRASEILSADDSPETSLNAEAAKRMRATFRSLGAQMLERPWPRILLMHAMVRKATVGLGQPLAGCDLEVGLEDLALADAHFVGLGHVHKAQEWYQGCPIVYVGSPRRTKFGELEDKSYVVAELDDKGLLGWERVLTPCSRMVHIQWQPGAEMAPAADLAGSEVLLQYNFTPEDRAERQRSVGELADKMRAAGALVTVDDVAEANMHARAPEVALASSPEEKLVAFWKAKDRTPEPETMDRLLAKLRQIQQERMLGRPAT